MNSVLEDRRYLLNFKSTLLPQLFCDVLVIGSGVAGIRAAMEASSKGRDVIVLAKGDLSESATAWAQGGIASASRPPDEPAFHVRDTIEAGARRGHVGATPRATGRSRTLHGPRAVHRHTKQRSRIGARGATPDLELSVADRALDVERCCRVDGERLEEECVTHLSRALWGERRRGRRCRARHLEVSGAGEDDARLDDVVGDESE